ncbi:alkaline ceramidase 1 isoform X2 [Rhineura floridana]|nr:alkaline ceramidase 1 isoform X2 [Rhineura floridana]
MAPLIVWMSPQYMNYSPVPVQGLAILQVFIGVFSIYFHMTLSYAGQLLDEIAILWTMGWCYAFWFPMRHFPGFIKNREQFMSLVAILTVLSSLMTFLKPALNAYALNCIAFHIVYSTCVEVRKCNNPRVHRLFATMVAWWIISISCWLTDKFLCGVCQKVSFSYFHSFWHVFISVALFYCANVCMYFDVAFELPSAEPDVEYWPSNTSFISMPYISLPNLHKQC